MINVIGSGNFIVDQQDLDNSVLNNICIDRNAICEECEEFCTIAELHRNCGACDSCASGIKKEN